MTAATAAADLSDDGRPESTVTRCSSYRTGKDEVAKKESSQSGGKFSPPVATDDDANVVDVTTAAFQSVALLEASERASLGGGGTSKG